MFTPRDFVWMLIIPGAIGLVLSLIGAGLKARRGIAPLAIVLGFLIAFPFIKSGHWEWPQIPPPPSTGAKGWLPAIAIIALIAGWSDALVRLSWWLRAIVTAIASVLALTLLLKFKFASSWAPSEGAIAITLLSISAAVWCHAAQDVIAELPATSLVILWLIASCIAVVLLLIATLDYGQLCITLAAGVFSLLPAIVWRRSDNALRGLAVVFAILITSLLAGAFYTSELGLMQLLILGSAPIFLWLSRWLPIRSKTWRRAALRIAVTLIPLATAVGLAVSRFHHEQQQEQQEQEL